MMHLYILLDTCLHPHNILTRPHPLSTSAGNYCAACSEWECISYLFDGIPSFRCRMSKVMRRAPRHLFICFISPHSLAVAQIEFTSLVRIFDLLLEMRRCGDLHRCRKEPNRTEQNEEQLPNVFDLCRQTE